MTRNVVDQIEEWIEGHKEQLVKDVISLVNIKSVSEKSDAPYIYGQGCAKVLQKALDLCQRYGFETKNHEYRCGTAIAKGETEEEIGIFAHLDVVPEGDNWIFEPYHATIHEGHIVGRGASDNKGPAMAATYAVRCLKELGISLKHTIKLYYGCDEEAGMSDITYYLEHNAPPKFSFAPDCAFSVCNGEKGIMRIKLGADIGESNLTKLAGGTACNMIPGFAYALLEEKNYNKINALIEENKIEGISVFYQQDQIGVTAEGISGHVAFPDGTVNAIQKLCAFLDRFRLVTGDAKEPIRFIAKAFADAYGQGLGIDYEDEVSGKLTCVGSTVDLSEGRLIQTVNIRYSITADPDKIIEKIEAMCKEYHMEIIDLENDAPSYVPEDHKEVRLLNDICNQVLHTQYAPFVMGGGTYARKLPNAVGYGCGLPNTPGPFGKDKGDGHQADECVKIKDLLNAIKVYSLALIALDEIV